MTKETLRAITWSLILIAELLTLIGMVAMQLGWWEGPL